MPDAHYYQRKRQSDAVELKSGVCTNGQFHQELLAIATFQDLLFLIMPLKSPVKS